MKYEMEVCVGGIILEEKRDFYPQMQASACVNRKLVFQTWEEVAAFFLLLHKTEGKK